MNEKIVCVAALENAEFFRDHNSVTGKSFFLGFKTMVKHSQEVSPLLETLRREAPHFDLDPQTPGNGYRSFLKIFDACFERCLQFCQTIQYERSRIFFFLFANKYAADLDRWNQILLTLRKFLKPLHSLLEWSREDGGYSLFPSSKHPSDELLAKVQSIETSCFYGRYGGFQLCASTTTVLSSMLSVMTTYSEYYYSSGSTIERLATTLNMGLKYFWDGDHRAKRMDSLKAVANIEFCKTLLGLADSGLMKMGARIMGPSLEVNHVMQIDPIPLRVQLSNGGSISVPPPNSHGPPTPIQVRLLSAKRRPGMPGSPNSVSQEQVSDSLIIQCHGGGFVAMSSEWYEIFLCKWAVDLDVPILSIDYSLAPEFPFPRSVQEILYIYAWALNNPQILGTTAKKIILIGDSAGGNLAVGVTLLASYLNLPMPSGLFLAYSTLAVHSFPSPSRFLLQIDLLLPCDFVPHCQKAYVGHLGISNTVTSNEKALLDRYFSSGSTSKTIKSEGKSQDRSKWKSWPQDLELFTDPKSPLLSSCFASDEELKKLPPVSLVCTDTDFCLDESVEFAKRCRRLGCSVTLDVLPDLPHGFIFLSLMSAEASDGAKLCIQRIRELLNTPSNKT